VLAPTTRRVAILGAVILALAAAACPALSFTDPGDAGQLAGRLAEAMTDQELLGQVLFLGWQGVGPSADILRWIGERGIGGVKIFPRNVSSLPSLARDVSAMQALARRNRLGIPLFVATDQEGGWVRQIKDETSQSPGNLALGAAGAPGDAYLTGWYLGRELAALGITMDFAPTADVYLNPEASVIGPRSFGSDPAMTGMLSAAYARGMANAGVLCVAKHFPGHGSADKDSHGHLPRLDESLDQLLQNDLVPYRILIREGVPGIMSGHLAFPRILGGATPASLSPYFLKTVLRGRLGFTGLVITDDMEMEGVLDDGKGTPSACRRALEAGNDMVLVSHTPATQEQTWQYLMGALRSAPALRAVLRDDARRIVETKLRFFRAGAARAPAQAAAPGPAAVRAAVPAPGAGSFFAQVSARAVTLVAGAGIPYRPAPRERILLCGQYPEFLAEGLKRWPGADTWLFPFEPFYNARPADKAAARARAAAYDTVIFCLANYNSLGVLQEMRGGRARVLCLSALSPVYLAEARWLTAAVAVYGDTRDSFRAGLAVLAGDYRATGTLPVRFAAEAGG
jgi:beta-N-acetylhexosaminidase